VERFGNRFKPEAASEFVPVTSGLLGAVQLISRSGWMKGLECVFTTEGTESTERKYF